MVKLEKVMTDIKPVTGLKADILRALTLAAPQALTRRQLLHHLSYKHQGLSDRAIRKAIEELRRRHPWGGQIISSSRSPGYRMSDQIDELEAANKEDMSRMLCAREKILNRRRAIEILQARPLSQMRLGEQT